MRLKILLLQARNGDDPMRHAERRSFAEKTGLGLEQIVPHDLLAGPPRLADLAAHDAVMVGGSGDYYVSNRTLPHFEAQLEFLREVVERGHPMFASCFGFQILVAALGGEVTHDPESMEVGTYRLTVSAEGRRDPLMGRLPESFEAQMGQTYLGHSIPSGAGFDDQPRTLPSISRGLRRDSLSRRAAARFGELQGEPSYRGSVAWIPGAGIRLNRRCRRSSDLAGRAEISRSARNEKKPHPGA
jgi:GMP synthase-like glutamine amidotransferase